MRGMRLVVMALVAVMGVCGVGCQQPPLERVGIKGPATGAAGEESKVVRIVIPADGKARVGGVERSDGELGAELRRFRAGGGERAVLVPDAELKYERLVAIYDVCIQAGIEKISFEAVNLRLHLETDRGR